MEHRIAGVDLTLPKPVPSQGNEYLKIHSHSGGTEINRSLNPSLHDVHQRCWPVLPMASVDNT